MEPNLRKNGTLVLNLSASIREGATSLSQAPRLLKSILKNGCWRKRIIAQTGQTVEFERFEDFATTEPLEGLGIDIETIRRICGDDVEALDLLDKTLRGKAGGRNLIHYNIMNEQGTSKAYALSKLRRSSPELHAKVLAGELSPNEAMIKAGFRTKTITVPIKPEDAARTLARHFKKAGLWEELLTKLNEQK